MPEGPSIVILKEAVASFKNRKVIAATGNSTKIDFKKLEGKRIIDFKSWGKHFLICFKNHTIRIHFLLFGTYRINESKESVPRLHLQFDEGELNFYACSVQELPGPPDKIYDFTADVMNKDWDALSAKKKLKEKPEMLVCDALLEQDIFAGVGNIIKNEVLYRVKIHPESKIGKLPAKKLNELIKQAVEYSFDFLEWKKQYTLKKHWLAHTKKICIRCDLPLMKKYAGNTKRRTFYCENCQVLYS